MTNGQIVARKTSKINVFGAFKLILRGFLLKGWDPTFLIRAIGLSEKKLLIIYIYFFFYLDLKSKNLRVNPKKISYFFISMFPYFRFVLIIFTTQLTTKCIKCLFHMENQLDWAGIGKSVERILRINQKSENICKKSINFFSFPIVDFDISNVYQKRQNKTNHWLFR